MNMASGTAMDFFRNFSGTSTANDPPASVLAEWNKYSGQVDIESQVPVTQGGSLLSRWQDSFTTASSSVTSGFQFAPNAPQQGFRIPSGTDFVYFAALVGGAVVFFFLAFFLFLPLLIVSPGKFALSFTFGSVCTMSAFNMLGGWRAALAHMFSSERLPFTTVYIGSMMGTVYAALIMNSYILSIVFSAVQVIALLYYVLSYFPGGAAGVQFMLSMAGRTILSCVGSVFRGR